MIERYSDKQCLAEYDLDAELFDKFGLKINNVIPIRNVFILCTDNGNKILKKIDYSVEEVQFIYEATEYIKRKLNRVSNFDKTIDGQIFCEFKGGIYCIMPLVTGRECEFTNPVDLSIVASGLGELHSASEGFRFPELNKYVCGKLIDTFKRRYEEMLFFKSIAKLHVNKNEFDDLFLKNADEYMEEMQKSIRIIEKSSYYKLCSEEDKIALCHHDLAHHNIIIKDNEAFFIDFDLAVVDLKVHDLCNLINKVMKSNNYDIDKAEILLNNYCRTNTLDKRERDVLYGYLCFPDEFYTICRDYYTRRKEWDDNVFFERFIRKLENKDERKEFTNEIGKLL